MCSVKSDDFERRHAAKVVIPPMLIYKPRLKRRNFVENCLRIMKYLSNCRPTKMCCFNPVISHLPNGEDCLNINVLSMLNKPEKYLIVPFRIFKDM